MYRTVIAAGLALLALAGGPASGADFKLMNPNVAYSATRVLQAQGERIEQRYYQQSMGKNRADTEHEGQQSSMIMRLDRNLIWMVMPQQRMYMELSLADPQARARTVDIPDDDRVNEFEKVGREDVNGVKATKYRVATTDDKGRRTEGYMWISDEHSILVKMELADGAQRATMELKDLKVGAQPDSLFEPPAGFQKMSLGGMGGMMMGGSGAPASAPAPAAPAAPGAPAAEPGETDPNFAEEVADEAKEEAMRTTKDEVRRSVREGLRSILGR